ncbi:phage holin family protein [Roseateles oligotrophus]|uniref:Phage holin family protein n=1 Tax=Roseateles oligotrophus TaxID=1769250 RepID=A0ABT2YIL5_9BURK|nr:phage holin family protein [Roseateles oligotrophus]MCV2369848.1 phage holin family protein [Roseateles oligotrophus]
MTSEPGSKQRGDAEAAPGAGLMVSLRRFFGHGLEMVQIRIEQISLEFEAEKLRLFSALIQSLLALLLAAAALGMLSLCLLLVTPETWRWLTALVLGLLYLGLAWLCWGRAERQLSQPGGAFAGSVAELGRDRNALEP